MSNLLFCLKIKRTVHPEGELTTREGSVRKVTHEDGIVTYLMLKKAIAHPLGSQSILKFKGLDKEQSLTSISDPKGQKLVMTKKQSTHWADYPLILYPLGKEFLTPHQI